MKGWGRLGIVLSGFWIAGVIIYSISEFISILPGECVNSEGEGIPISASIELFFFSCNPFSDIASFNSWGLYFIHWGNQLIEFNTRRFVFVLLLPVGSLWSIAIAVVWAWRWVARGFKE